MLLLFFFHPSLRRTSCQFHVCLPHPPLGQSLERKREREREREREGSLWVAEISRHQCYRFNHSHMQTKERQPRGKQTIRPNMFDNKTPALWFHSSHFEVQMTLTDKQTCSGFALFIYLDFFGYGLRKEAWCSEVIRCLKIELEILLSLATAAVR